MYDEVSNWLLYFDFRRKCFKIDLLLCYSITLVSLSSAYFLLNYQCAYAEGLAVFYGSVVILKLASIPQFKYSNQVANLKYQSQEGHLSKQKKINWGGNVIH